jgi:hypothetical protein
LPPPVTYRRLVLGLELDTVRNVALVVIAAAVVLVLVGAWLIKAIVGKLVVVGLVGGLAVAVWSQRESVEDCAGRVETTLHTGAVDDATCTFFGRPVRIPSPRGD